MKRLFALAALLLSAAAPFDPFGMATIDERPGLHIALDGIFAEAGGRPTTIKVIARGRPVLLVPVLHDCPNFCGVTLDGVLGAAEHAGISGVAIIAFGIDPRERVASASADLARLAARHPQSIRSVAALTGSEAAIRSVTDALGYHYGFDGRTGQYAHVAATAVLTPDGRLVRWLYGVAPRPDDLSSAVADARAGRTGGIVDRLILLCYHYDPSRGLYGIAIDRLLKAGCAITVLLLLGYILLARRREPKPC